MMRKRQQVAMANTDATFCDKLDEDDCIYLERKAPHASAASTSSTGTRQQLAESRRLAAFYANSSHSCCLTFKRVPLIDWVLSR